MLQTAAYVQEAVFFRHLFEGEFPRSKHTISPRPQTAAKFCALNLFFRPGNKLQKLSFNGQ